MTTEDVRVFRLRSDDVAWREVDDEVVILDLQRSVYHSVSPVGTFLWPYLEEGATRQQLVEQVLSVYEVDRETAEGDIDRFVAALEELGLLAVS